MSKNNNWITKEIIENSINTIYIFGDNLQHRGLGGQAKICRPFVDKGKAIGIPTKRSPTMYDSAFFSDKIDEAKAINKAIDEISEKYREGYKIVFLPNIGKGYAQMPHRSPILYKLLNEYINIFRDE